MTLHQLTPRAERRWSVAFDSRHPGARDMGQARIMVYASSGNDAAAKVRTVFGHDVLIGVVDEVRPVDAPVNPVGPNHPATAQAAGRRMALRLGSKRQKVYEWIKARGLRGATADEVGEHFGWGHQSASAAVSTLKKDGWLVVRRYDGHPVTRPTRSGNPAEVMITREDTNDR